MIKILLIEDDVELAELLKIMLADEGIESKLAFTSQNGLDMLKEGGYDALVLDLGLPDIDGYEVCKQVRENTPDLPIIISSARGEALDKIKGFELGADDYIAKPYQPLELAFRLRAILRRGLVVQSEDKSFELQKEGRVVKRDGREILFTKAEYDIFAYLYEKEGIVVSREELLMNIESLNFQSGLKSIDVIMNRIRQKIGDESKNPKFIHSVRGVGYKFINA